jgi:hypothetical protein
MLFLFNFNGERRFGALSGKIKIQGLLRNLHPLYRQNYNLISMKTPIQRSLLNSPVRLMLITLLSSLVLFVTVDSFVLDNSDAKSLWIEAHGLIFDLFVFGVVLTLYDALKYRKGERLRRESKRLSWIQSFQNDIEDFRDWEERAATLRIAGNIKRLNRQGVTDINLNHCHLSAVRLLEVNLEGSNLRHADFRHAKLWKANLQKVRARGANFEEAVLWGAQMDQADLEGADLRGADLREASLKEANLRNVRLSGARVLGPDWIEDLREWEVGGAEVIAQNYQLKAEPKTHNTFILRQKKKNLK